MKDLWWGLLFFDFLAAYTAHLDILDVNLLKSALVFSLTQWIQAKCQLNRGACDVLYCATLLNIVLKELSLIVCFNSTHS